MIPIETPSQILSELNRCHGDSSQNIVCNVCDTNRNARKVTIEVPTSATCQTLLGRVGNRLGYALEAFLLYYQEPDGHETSEEGVCLNDVPTQLLQSVVGNNLRQNFYLTLRDAKKDLQSTGSNEIIENTKLDVRTKTTGATSIVSNCITSNLSDSKDNKLNYGNYSVPPVVMKSETGYVGLVNQAMTCYLNSLLQTLFMTPEFRNAVYRWEYEGTDEEGVKSIPYQLQRLFLMQQTSNRKSIGTTDITRSFGWDSSDAWHQHDIQELCRVMFDALEKTWKNTEQADFISNLYQGRMKDCVQCLKCNWESARVVAYQDIPLAVKPFGEGKAYSSVEESLTAFCAHELLDGNDQWFCEKCNVKVDAHKSLKFITFPYLLTIHLMRFDFDYNTLRRIKLNHRLSFPDLLDLNQYVVHSDSSSESTSVNAKSEEQHLATKAQDDCDGICNSKECSASESASLADDHGSNSKGPYLYELFSIMVHSGNASGGHYYAYIKSFEKDQWFSFNDQNVMTITYDDIKKTYGGSSSVYGHYSSSYASSTNAYMLMYRRIDREKNAKFMQIDQFPAHLQRELQKMRDKEDSERRQLEMDRSTCKIKLFVFHPVEQKLLESTLAVHMNKTLAEATEIAWELFELRGVVPLNCVRLVKYDGSQDYIDRSFDDEEGLPMHRILGGVKFFYGFDLLLDVKKPDQSFSQYKSGGISIKVFVVDLTNETISFPVTIRATLTQTVGNLKQIAAEELGVSPENLHCVLQTHSELKALNDPGRLLKVEEFARSNKMFVEASGIESDVEFRFSRLFEVIDHYENTIRIHVQLPLGSNDADCPSVNSQDVPDTSFSTASSDGAFEKTVSHPHNSDDLRDSSKDEALHVPLHSDRRVNEIASCNSNADLRATDVDDSSKTDFSGNSSNLATTNAASQDLCYINAKASNGCSVPSEQGSDEGFDSQNGVNSWDMERGDWVNSAANSKENVYKNYFRAMLQVDAETKQRSLSVTLDKRITLDSLKSCLQSYVGTTANNFEVFRLTGSGEEIEMKRLSESLSMYDDDCQFKVKLGRPLQKGEQRVKIHQLLINDPEPIKFLAEVVISKGMTILQAKMSLLRELKSKQVMDILPPVERCRLRRKCWKNPGNIYVDTQAFDGQDICLMPNMDLLLEILDAPDQLRVTSDDQLSIYIRRWWPSKYELGSITELIIDEDSSFDLIKKISAFSGIPEENVQFCKITGIVFPYDVSLFEIHSGLSWVPRDNGPPVLKSLSIYADGAVFFYRDKAETVKVLTNDEKRELQQKENARTLPSSSPSLSSWRKERALKIYLDETPKTSSCS